MPWHTVKSGESLSSIARAYGFANWRVIYDHPNNSEFRKKRPDPNLIYPDDKVFVPDKVAKHEDRPAGGAHKFVVKPKKAIWNLRWDPNHGSCGDSVKLCGDTNLPDGTSVKLALKTKQGSSPNLKTLHAIKVSHGKIELPWEIRDVAFNEGASFHEFVEIEATSDDASIPSNPALLKVEALLNAAEDSFSAVRAWSGFTNNSEFKQKIEKFTCKVNVSFNILKAWGAYYVDLSSAGVAATAGGCPWAGYRWGRATGANAMAPNEYYDGTAWVPLPAAFVLTGTNHSAISFYKSGANFVSTSGGTWPGNFADYDFNSAKYTAKRNNWMRDTHSRWSGKFFIRRKNCKSKAKTWCCRYAVGVRLAFTTVAAYAAGVIAMCPGNLRSNASNWFMDEPRVTVAAHESGHHMDNPDEYAGGAVDPTLNGDGAVNGIDNDSIMGQNLTKLKKRHYHAFVEMTKKLIKSSYGREFDYETVNE